MQQVFYQHRQLLPSVLLDLLEKPITTLREVYYLLLFPKPTQQEEKLQVLIPSEFA